MPASINVAEFLGHTAWLGCSKCLKEFPTSSFGEKPNYSGYNHSQWVPHTSSSHCSHALTYVSAETKSKREAIASRYRLRLLDLPYFDPIKHVVFDPMHNLLLGTAKHAFEVWIEKEILSSRQLKSVQSLASWTIVPRDIGWLPCNVESDFSYFTADQWRNWIRAYSLVSLKRHIAWWTLFLLAALHISLLHSHGKRLLQSMLLKADPYVHNFCMQFESLYGSEKYTPNVHLHLHLRECIFQYWPVYAFLCFCCKHFNGLLGSYHTNMKVVEPQMMHKFLEDQHVFILYLVVTMKTSKVVWKWFLLAAWS